MKTIVTNATIKSQKILAVGGCAAGFLMSSDRLLATDIGPDAFGYRATSNVAYQFQDISSTGTVSSAVGDDSSTAANIGFNFNFYGATYSTAYVSTNGLITFGSANASYSNSSLAEQNLAFGPTIATLWDDWVANPGRIYTQTVGTSGNRQFITQWNLINGFSSSPSTVTFQSVLSESNGSIRMSYADVDSGDGRSFGAASTVGITDASGYTNNRYLQWSNNQAIVGNNNSILFTQAGGGNWLNATSNNNAWSTDGNWSNGTAPTSADDATFGLTATYLVNFTSGATANNVSVSAGALAFNFGSQTLQAAGNLNVNGGSLSLPTMLKVGTASSGQVGVSGTINLAGGTLIIGSLNLGGVASRLNWTGGTLWITGGSTDTGLTIPAGATLKGTTTIGGALNITGTLAPGNSPGSLTVNGTLDFLSGSNFSVDVNGTTPGTGFDQVTVNGLVDLTGANLLVDLGAFSPVIGQSFLLILNDGTDAVTGTFANLSQDPAGWSFFNQTVGANTYHFRVDYNAGTGNDVSLSAVPEPTSIGLIALGATALLGRRRRKVG